MIGVGDVVFPAHPEVSCDLALVDRGHNVVVEEEPVRVRLYQSDVVTCITEERKWDIHIENTGDVRVYHNANRIISAAEHE